MTEEQEWRFIRDHIHAGFGRLRSLKANARHANNQEKASMVEAAILDTFQKILDSEGENRAEK